MTRLNWAVSPLRSSELFEGLSRSTRQSILSASKEEMISSGQPIFREGEPKQKILVLMKGLVKVSQLSQRGDEAIFWLNVPGEVIGSLTYLNDSKYSFTALALQPCKVVMWTMPQFEAILDHFPVVLRNVWHIIARQTAELSSRICEMSTAPAEQRLAGALMRMIGRNTRNVNGYCQVNLTQEDLSSIIGTTVYTVNRLLSLWEQQGLIARQRCRIVMRDLAGLSALRVKIHPAACASDDSAALVSFGSETFELCRNANRARGACAPRESDRTRNSTATSVHARSAVRVARHARRGILRTRPPKEAAWLQEISGNAF